MATQRNKQTVPRYRNPSGVQLGDEIEATIEVPQWPVSKARAVYDVLKTLFEPQRGTNQ